MKLNYNIRFKYTITKMQNNSCVFKCSIIKFKGDGLNEEFRFREVK